MALFEVVLSQVYFQQQTINRWTYEGSGTPAAVSMSFALASALGAIYDEIAIPPAYPPGKLVRAIAQFQSNDVTFETLSVKNIYSVTDFYETPFIPALVGVDAGESESPTVALGFRTNRIRTDVARGTKRFVGVTENYTGNGGTIPLDDDVIVGIANAMSEVLTYDDEGSTLTFTPVVCGKEKYEVEVDGVPTGRFAYRYFPTLAEQMEHTAVGVTWQPYDRVRTQTSRQYGRGM